MSDLTDADQLADVFASFAVSKNPTGLSLGIDSAYELGDHIASTWLAAHDAKVQAEALREFANSIPGDVHDPMHVADLARGVADHIEREAGLK